MPQNSTELFEILNTIIERPASKPLEWESELHALGFDSLARVEAILQIEERYEMVFPDDDIVTETFATPAALWAVMQRSLADRSGLN